MAAGWIEKITGSWEDKRRYREYRERVKQLPPAYRTTTEALERYATYFGAISKGDVLVRMLDDLVVLFEQAAADGTPVRQIVGEDPVEFAEEFLRSYSDGQWINTERERLIKAVDQATEESS